MTELTKQSEELAVGSYFLPAWWVNAYESLFIDSAIVLGDPSRPVSLMPILNLKQLGFLCEIIDIAQRQLMTQPQPEFSVDLGNIYKTSRLPRANIDECLSLLGSIRLIDMSSTPQRLVPLFESEQWNGQRVDFVLSSVGCELILGFANAYGDLRRKLETQPQTRNLITTTPPLLMWKSLWLDLTGVEQYLALRLEKAVSWDGRWIRFDGAFAESLASLMNAQTYSETSKSSAASPDDFSPLLRLGRKLRDHGMITQFDTDEPIAMGDTEDDLFLCWKLSESRLASQDMDIYKSHVSQVFSRQNIFNVDDFLRIFGKSILSANQESSLRLALLQKIEQPSTLLPCLAVSPTQIVDPLMLFAEWWIRSRPTHVLSLQLANFPESLRTIFVSPENDPVQALERFLQVVAQDEESIIHAARQPQACLASNTSLADPEVTAYLMQVNRAPTIPSSPSLFATPVETKANIERPKPNAPRDNLRRIAAEELTQLKKQHPDAYSNLIKRYTDSLDPSAKRVVTTVRDRMQPHLFEEHLKQRLVKFMIENPSAWQTTSH